MTTMNMHMKVEIEIAKQTWLMHRKPCRLQTYGRTDGQSESSIPPSNFVDRGIIKNYIYHKVLDKITHPFPNFHGVTIEVWE